MQNGEQLRFRGPAGAPFVVTVGVAFSAAYIAQMVANGEWTPIEEAAPEAPAKAAPRKRTARRPAPDA